jgi:monoamine oxidase
MNANNITASDLLSAVEVKLGPERTLELIKDIGAHPAPLDSGAPPDLGPPSQTSRVVVIGGGVAGLVLTYELAQRGVDVELWEASSRLGGRNFTVRPGEVIQEEGHKDQECKLPKGGYLNAGPGRISHHHRAVLYYCRRFGITLRPYQTLNRAALLHRWLPQVNQDVVVRNRQVQFDGQGRIGELAAKLGPWLDPESPVPADLADAMRAWLQDNFNVKQQTNKDWHYCPSGRQGFAKQRGGAGQPGQQEKPLDLDQILGLHLWYDDPRRSPDVIDEQLSMFELEGGNDGLIQALAAGIKGKVRLNRRLTQMVRNEDGGVTLRACDATQGEIEEKSDRVVLAIQPQVMQNMDLDLPSDRLEGLRSLPPRFAVKVGGWMHRRFWEEDLGIYGGISFTNMPNQQVWYPNDNFHDPNGGLLVMAYAALQQGEALGAMNPDERCRITVELAKRIHPEINEELDPSTLLTIAWQNVPNIRSPWVAWTPELYKLWFTKLTEPCGPVAFAGDWCSHLPAWQEGAIRSAYSLLPWAIS